MKLFRIFVSKMYKCTKKLKTLNVADKKIQIAIYFYIINLQKKSSSETFSYFDQNHVYIFCLEIKEVTTQRFLLLTLQISHEIIQKPLLVRTSRERPKSAPYLRLKNSKRISKCQVFSSTVPA